MSRQRYPSPMHGAAGRRQQDGLNSQSFLSGAGVQAALGGLGYTVNGRPANGPGQGIPVLQPSIFSSPKAPAGGRLNSEPPTPTNAGPSNGRPSAHTPTRTGPTQSFSSPKVGSGYSYSPGPTRRPSNGLNNTAPAGSLSGIVRMIDSSKGGMYQAAAGLAATRGAAAAAGGSLSATLPASRPPTAGQSALHTTTRPPSGTLTAQGRPGSAVPGFAFSVGSNQSMGSRGYQEDYRAILDATSTPGMAGLPNVMLGAAVYDGHGGKQVSHWLATSYCLLQRAMEAVQSLMSSGGSPGDVSGVLEEIFEACGRAALQSRMSAGSCVALALLVQAAGVPWVLSANVGDSRTVLVSWDDEGGGRPEGAALSIDHKLGPAKSSEETRRVQAAGGTVIQLFGTWRIDGSLAVARAIGDADFSRYVSYRPTVSCRQLLRRDRWLIIASDGLWDVMTNEEVALFCRAQHALSAAKLAEALVREATRNRGSGDNTTVVAIRLQYSPQQQGQGQGA